MPENRPISWRTSTRRGTLSVVLWAFGLAMTLLLVGLWGRAVTHDQPTIEASAQSAVDAGVASDRIYGWIEDAVASSEDVDPVIATQVMTELDGHPEIEAAIAALVDQFVAALFVNDGEAPGLELTDTLGPVVPLVVSAFREHDEVVDEDALTTALLQAERLDLDSGDAAAIASVADDARSLMSVIVVLSSLALMFTALCAVWLSYDRPAMVRLLATRVVLSALSFAVLFRMGAWVLDPSQGGSSMASGASILLGSNAHVFVRTAAVGGVVAGGVAWYIMRARRAVRPSTDAIDADDDTRELISI